MSNMELETLDYYTKDLHVAGQMIRHKDKVPDGCYVLTVEIVATDGHGSLLCIRKPQYTGIGAGKWELPAGYAVAGESAQEAAYRELYEETGLTATQMVEFSRFLRKGMIRIAFAAYVPNLLDQVITLQPDEAVDYKFLTVRDWLTVVSTGACEPERCRAYTTDFIQNMKKYVGTLPEEKRNVTIPVNLEIGTAIQAIRIEQGMTQELLSKYAGISRASLSQIEKGGKQPTFPMLCKIAAAMDMRVSELISRAEDMADTESQNKPVKSLIRWSLREDLDSPSMDEPTEGGNA